MTEQIEKILVEWVKLYPQKLLFDLMRMTHEAGDAYNRLYLILLTEGGSMPYDLDSIAIAVQWQCLEFAQKIWPQIKHKFVVVNGYLTLPLATEALLEAQKRLQDKRRAGLMGSQKRYSSAIAVPKQRHSTAIVLPVAERQQCHVVKSNITITKRVKGDSPKIEQPITTDFSKPLLLVTAIAETDKCKKRFEELFPVATPFERKTIGKLIRHCSHLAQTTNGNALKKLLSMIVRCHEAKKNPGWIMKAAKNEGMAYTKGK